MIGQEKGDLLIQVTT